MPLPRLSEMLTLNVWLSSFQIFETVIIADFTCQSIVL